MAKRQTASQLRDLQAENMRLKRENTRLKVVARKNCSTVTAPDRFLNGLRSSGVVIFLALAVALITVGNLLFWTGSTIVNTDRYMNTVGTLIKNSQIQSALAQYTTNQLFQRVDVETITEQALPPRAAFLAPQLTSQLKTGTDTALKKILAKPQVQDTWLKVQRRQHERLISFAADYKGDGTISLNDLYQQMSGNLKSTKLSFLADKQLPANVGSVTVVTAGWLPVFHKVVTHINTWRIIAGVAMVVSLGLAILLSRRRRRVLYGFGWATAAMMFATLVSLRVVRQISGDHVNAQYAEAVRTAAKIILHSLVVQTTIIMGLALLLVVIVSAVNGKFRWASNGIRQGWSAVVTGTGPSSHNRRAISIGQWLPAHKRQVEYCLLAATLLAMLLIQPSIHALAWLVLLLAVIVVIIERIAALRNDK